MLSRARLLGILWTPARHAPVLLGCSRHELEVDDHPLLQGIFPTRRWYPGLPHCSWILFRSEPPGSPQVLLNTDKMPWEINVKACGCPPGSARSGWSRLGPFRPSSVSLGSARPRSAPPLTGLDAGVVLRPSPHRFRRRRVSYAPPLTRPDSGVCATLRPSHAQTRAKVVRSVPRCGFRLLPLAEESIATLHDAGEFAASSEADPW